MEWSVALEWGVTIGDLDVPEAINVRIFGQSLKNNSSPPVANAGAF